MGIYPQASDFPDMAGGRAQCRILATLDLIIIRDETGYPELSSPIFWQIRLLNLSLGVTCFLDEQCFIHHDTNHHDMTENLQRPILSRRILISFEGVWAAASCN